MVSCLHCPDRRVSRKAMTTLAYMLSQRREDCVAAWREGAGRPLAAALQLPAAGSPGCSEEGPAGSAEDSDFRQAALGALVQLAGHPQVWAELQQLCRAGVGGSGDSVGSGMQGPYTDSPSAASLQLLVSRLLAAHDLLVSEELDARAEERALLLQLGSLLAAGAAPEAQQDGSDNITAAQFEEGERGELAMRVNTPGAGLKAVRDAAEGARTLGSAAVGVASTNTSLMQGQGPQRAALAPDAPLLLGPP